MALVNVYVVRVEGEPPRRIVVDNFVGKDGKEVKGGASLIESLKRQVKREQLHSVTVVPVDEDASVPVRKVAKKATAKAEAESGEGA